VIRVKIHVSNNSLLPICLLIMLDTLLLIPSLHCNKEREIFYEVYSGRVKIQSVQEFCFNVN